MTPLLKGISMTDPLIEEAENILRQLTPEALKICLEQTRFALAIQNAVLNGLNKDKKRKEVRKNDRKK